MSDVEGYLVRSRWGLKLHRAGCPCGVCKSRRKSVAGSSQPPDGAADAAEASGPASGEGDDSPAWLDPAAAPGLLPTGIQTAPPAVRGVRSQATPASEYKPAVKGRLCMELLALGTPEVPLNRVRVPRQAATAAKAAIRKDVMEQNRRLGAAPDSASPPLQMPGVAESPLPEACTKATLKRAASKQTAKKPPKRAKVDDTQGAEDIADDDDDDDVPPQPHSEAEPPRQGAAAVHSPSRMSRHSGESNKSRHRAAAVGTGSPSGPQSRTCSARKARPQNSTADAESKPASGDNPPTVAQIPAQAVAAEAPAELAAASTTIPGSSSRPEAISADTLLQADVKVSPGNGNPPAAEAQLKKEDDAKSESGDEAHTHSSVTKSASQAGGGGTDATKETAGTGQQEVSAAEQFAQQVRSKAGWGPAVDVNVRSLMASATLAGQPVHIQLKNREPVYLQGTIQPNGMVRCAMHVGGVVNHECSLSEFEKLGASKERRPGENIHLTHYSMALKDFCSLVNDIGENARSQCMKCKLRGGVIKCKGCSIAAHPQCVELTSRQQQANWFCKDCKASGQDKMPQRPQDLPARARAPPRPPARPQSAPAASVHHDSSHSHIPSSKGNDTSCVSPAGRVHMAVPVSNMTPARRERNGNKHKRLFLGGEGALTHGEPVVYKTQQHGLLLEGEVHISPGSDANTGILCKCCNTVVSCSKFEAHAGQGSRRAPYDNIFTADGVTLRARAAQLPPLTEEEGQMLLAPRRRASASRHRGAAGALGGIVDGCRDVIHDLDHDAGGCSVCGRPDFALGAFCDRTMILCDQCEREFHVGCMRQEGRCDLTQLPTGDWFCSEVCSSIWDKLNAHVAAGLTPLHPPDYPPGYTIQMLRGRMSLDKPDAAATNDAIDIAQNVLQESFDPIIDKATKENLLLLMTKAEVKGEYDYRGMYTALLSHEGRPVCAAVMRAFGAQLAEVPLVATKADARRQGHCRVLMQAFEHILKKAGVRTMCLPAAHETVMTWIHGFGLTRMPLDDLDAACKELRLLIFPGTQVLHKQLLAPLPPPPPPSQPQMAAAAGGAAAAAQITDAEPAPAHVEAEQTKAGATAMVMTDAEVATIGQAAASLSAELGQTIGVEGKVLGREQAAQHMHAEPDQALAAEAEILQAGDVYAQGEEQPRASSAPHQLLADTADGSPPKVDATVLTTQPVTIPVSSHQFQDAAEPAKVQAGINISLEASTAADQLLQADAAQDSHTGSMAGPFVTQPEAEVASLLGHAEPRSTQQPDQEQEQTREHWQEYCQAAAAPDSSLQAPSQAQRQSVLHAPPNGLLNHLAEPHQQGLLGGWPVSDAEHAAAPAGPAEDDIDIMEQPVSDFPAPTFHDLPLDDQQRPPKGSFRVHPWSAQPAPKQGSHQQQLDPQPVQAGLQFQQAEMQLQAGDGYSHIGSPSQQSTQLGQVAPAHHLASQFVNGLFADNTEGHAECSGQPGADQLQVSDFRQPEDLPEGQDAGSTAVGVPYSGGRAGQNGWQTAATNEDVKCKLAATSTADTLDPLLEYSENDHTAPPEQNGHGTSSLTSHKRALGSVEDSSYAFPVKKQRVTLEGYA